MLHITIQLQQMKGWCTDAKLQIVHPCPWVTIFRLLSSMKNQKSVKFWCILFSSWLPLEEISGSPSLQSTNFADLPPICPFSLPQSMNLTQLKKSVDHMQCGMDGVVLSNADYRHIPMPIVCRALEPSSSSSHGPTLTDWLPAWLTAWLTPKIMSFSFC